MRALKVGDRVHLLDGRNGTITGHTDWGKYVVQPDNPTPDEVERELRFLIDFDKAVIVEEAV